MIKTTDPLEPIRQKLKASFIHQEYQIISSYVRTITGKAKVNETIEIDDTAIATDSIISYAVPMLIHQLVQPGHSVVIPW